MKKIFLAIAIIVASYCNAQVPKDYSCNNHVKYDVDNTNGQYNISYTFKDQNEILRTFKFSYNISKTLKNIARYGVPVSFFDNVSASVPQSKERMKAIKKGFFIQTESVLKPNRSALVSFYRPYCKAIAGGIVALLNEDKKDNRLSRIEMAMKFVQDIPYGIPQIKDSTWEIYGIYTPPEVLIRKYGDCDSKSILFACILSYLINSNDILFLFQGHNHALVAIKGKPDAKQKYLEVDKEKYILADVTGPARLAFGDDGNKFDSAVGYKIEKLKVKGYWWHSI